MRIATLIQAMCQLNWSQILDRLRFSFLWHLTFLALNAVLLHMDLYKFVTGYVLTTRPLSFEGLRLTWMVYLYLSEFLTTFMWLLNLVFSVRVSKSNRGRAVCWICLLAQAPGEFLSPVMDEIKQMNARFTSALEYASWSLAHATLWSV